MINIATSPGIFTGEKQMVERRKDEGERDVCCFPAPQKPACELRRTASLCWHVSQVLNEGMTQWLSLISGEIIASGHRQFGRTVLTCCQRSADKRNEKRKGGGGSELGEWQTGRGHLHRGFSKSTTTGRYHLQQLLVK